MSRSESRRLTELVSFRLDASEATVVANKAARHGLSVGLYAKHLVLADAGQILPRVRSGPPRDAAELRRLVGHIGKVGSNLNQLARASHAPGSVIDATQIKQASADLAVIRTAVMSVLRVHDP